MFCSPRSAAYANIRVGSSMCGIFGVVSANDRETDHALTRTLALALLRFSETRGREAVGMAIHDGTRIEVLKQGGSISDFLANPKLHQLLEGAKPRAIIGHSRLGTNGTQANI